MQGYRTIAELGGDAREALRLAAEEARLSGHDEVAVEHLLVGILRVDNGYAARVLRDLGVDAAGARAAVRPFAGRGDREVGNGGVVMGARANQAIELAFDEGRRQNHRRIHTEHLLLGLLLEGEGRRSEYLEALGLSRAEVLPRLIRAINDSGAYDTDTIP
jgi:ATP-dependent Clp protease ATP-binding subunit ClpC